MKRKVVSPDIQKKKLYKVESRVLAKDLKHELEEETASTAKKGSRVQPKQGHK